MEWIKSNGITNMIKSASYLLLAVLMASQAFAGIKLPAGVFRMAQLDQAMDLAKKQKITVILCVF